MKKILFFILLLSIFNVHARTGLLEGLGIDQTADTPPLVDEAFKLDVSINDATSRCAQW